MTSKKWNEPKGQYTASSESSQNVMTLSQVEKKYKSDQHYFMKNRQRYSSTFPFTFADYMVKYAKPSILKRWEKTQGIRGN